jgi:predicted TPR repeat methyltransferase
MNRVNPGDSHDREAALYDQYVSERGCYGNEALFGLMYELVKPGETVLDMGIGTGLSSMLLHRAGLRVSGFDSSRAMLDVCACKGFAIDLVQHDLHDVPYPYDADSFDHVLCVGVLHFFPDLAPVFREAARIVRPGGIFAFTVEDQRPNQQAEYVIQLGDDPHSQTGNATVHMFRHGEPNVARLLASCGFALVKRFEFFADRHPTEGHKIYFTAHVVRRAPGDSHAPGEPG